MKTIQITLDDNLHRRAKTLAYQTGETLTEFVRHGIAEKVERLEETKASLAPERGL